MDRGSLRKEDLKALLIGVAQKSARKPGAKEGPLWSGLTRVSQLGGVSGTKCAMRRNGSREISLRGGAYS